METDRTADHLFLLNSIATIETKEVTRIAGYSIRATSFFNSTVSYTYNHCAGTVDYRTTGILGY